jgi:CBS domain-containing protein
MLLKDVMTPAPVVCRPTDKTDFVANLMLEHNCGEIPVCEGSKILGVITDRDIATRVVAFGKTPAAISVNDVMTTNVFTISENETLAAALDLMEERLVRRLPVVDASGQLVGIVSQADLMARVPTLQVAKTLRNVARKTRRPHAAL